MSGSSTVVTGSENSGTNGERQKSNGSYTL